MKTSSKSSVKATTDTPPSRADVVIIGGGIMGLSVAYNLAKRNVFRDIVVLERGYLCGGASGRNGGGVRAQWSSETNIRLMRASLDICRAFAREHKINTWMRQGGYLFLARSEKDRSALESNVALQNRCGLATRMLSRRQTLKLVPELANPEICGASYNPDDAVVFPWAFVWGYAEGARKAGVQVFTFTDVVDVERDAAGISAVHTSAGSIRCRRVVNAAGAWSPEVSAMVGVELPNRPHRHEICSSEPLKPWLTPLVADLSSGLYFSQSTRGEIVGGISNERVPIGTNQDSSHRFLALYARALTSVCPVLGGVKLLRQWAGLYDLTPDRNPIVGTVDSCPGFFQVSGFMGHGFMMAPVMGKLLADSIADESDSPLLRRWNLRRFESGELLDEGMILG